MFDIPKAMLPEIRSSSDEKTYGRTAGKEGIPAGIPVSGCLGDQQAALFGQGCFRHRRSEKHIRNGLLLCWRTSVTNPSSSRYGLLTTLGYSRSVAMRRFTLLEGSVAITGRAHPVASRQSRADPIIVRNRNIGANGGRQRRNLFRTGVFGSVRSVLEIGRARSHCRDDAVCEQGAFCAGCSRSDCISDKRNVRSDGKGYGREGAQSESGRRNGCQRASDAVSVGHSEYPRDPSEGDGNDGFRRGLRCWISCRVLEGFGGYTIQLGERKAMDTANERIRER